MAHLNSTKFLLDEIDENAHLFYMLFYRETLSPPRAIPLRLKDIGYSTRVTFHSTIITSQLLRPGAGPGSCTSGELELRTSLNVGKICGNIKDLLSEYHAKILRAFVFTHKIIDL